MTKSQDTHQGSSPKDEEGYVFSTYSHCALVCWLADGSASPMRRDRLEDWQKDVSPDQPDPPLVSATRRASKGQEKQKFCVVDTADIREAISGVVLSAKAASTRWKLNSKGRMRLEMCGPQ
ncbi:uncharacterized protein PG986_011472 [Apiospora aurea]|uniref:Uncharacterized protein n=1 Tax=Apiospora aurea TaxID=335848 RepID=A0ABR1Q585_9PEZI